MVWFECRSLWQAQRFRLYALALAGVGRIGRRLTPMFDRFTDGAKKAMSLSRDEATKRRHDRIDAAHMLLGLLRLDPGEPVLRVLAALHADLDALRLDTEATLQDGNAPPQEQLALTPAAKHVLEDSMQEASQFGHNFIDSEHLLLGLLSRSEGPASAAFWRQSIDLPRARACVATLFGTGMLRVLSDLASTRPEDPLDQNPWVQGLHPFVAALTRQIDAAVEAQAFAVAAELRDLKYHTLSAISRVKQALNGP